MAEAQKLRIAVLAGDGVGPEITAATVEILQAAAQRASLPLDLEELPIGYASYNRWKSTLTEETIQRLRGHRGWILGPTFAGEYPKDDPIRGHPSGYLRKNFGLFANVRPVKAWPELNPLIADLDVTVIRENTQGFYPDRNMFLGYGEFLPTADVGISVRVITTAACDRFARFSLEYATALGHESLSILHKRTALPQTEGLFIGAFEKLKDQFPKVKTEVVRVDTFSSSLPREYKKYRLVATTNLFGDIASDQASGLAGGVAVAPSLNAGTDQAMAQAVHGTAPDIQGQNIANPTALALSTAMLLRWFDQKTPDPRCRDAAAHIERGIREARQAGALTRDLGGRTSTTDFTRAVVKAIEGR